MVEVIFDVEHDLAAAYGTFCSDGAVQVLFQQVPLHEGRRQCVGRSSRRECRASVNSNLVRRLLGGHRVCPHYVFTITAVEVCHAAFEFVENPVDLLESKIKFGGKCIRLDRLAAASNLANRKMLRSPLIAIERRPSSNSRCIALNHLPEQPFGHR